GIRDFHVTGVQTCALPIFGLILILDPVIAGRIGLIAVAVAGLAVAVAGLAVAVAVAVAVTGLAATVAVTPHLAEVGGERIADRRRAASGESQQQSSRTGEQNRSSRCSHGKSLHGHERKTTRALGGHERP